LTDITDRLIIKMLKITLLIVSLFCLYAAGKPLVDEIDGQEYVGVQSNSMKEPVWLPKIYDDSVCEQLTTEGCRTVKKMTYYGVECDFCVIEKDELCDDSNYLLAPCDAGLACYPTKSSRVLAPSGRTDLYVWTCQDKKVFDYIAEYSRRYGYQNLDETSDEEQIELFEKAGLNTEENDYEKYRKETPVGSPFDKNYIPKKFSSSEQPCYDHYEHWETIENKHRKNWEPYCDDEGLYDTTVPQCTTDFECWCTDSRGKVVEDNVRDACGILE